MSQAGYHCQRVCSWVDVLFSPLIGYRVPFSIMNTTSRDVHSVGVLLFTLEPGFVSDFGPITKEVWRT